MIYRAPSTRCRGSIPWALTQTVDRQTGMMIERRRLRDPRGRSGERSCLAGTEHAAAGAMTQVMPRNRGTKDGPASAGHEISMVLRDLVARVPGTCSCR